MVAVSDALDAEDCIAVSPSDDEDGSSTTSSSGSYIDYGQVRSEALPRWSSEDLFGVKGKL
jgi:hypothetical protein